MNLLTENWMIKLLSLVFALVLWFFVMGEQNLEKGFAVPIELSNIPEGLIVSNSVPSLIDVRISGPRSILFNLQQRDLAINIDLKGLSPGVTSYKRLEERFNLSRNLKVTRVSPSIIDVSLDRIRAKRVPVKVLLDGDPPVGFEVVSVVAKPSHVTVSGAGSELKNVSEVSTDLIQISAVREDFTQMVPIDYVGTFTALKDDKTVEVTVVIRPINRPAKGR
ncbi:MAG: YbbR-like domain-containing protein [Desulfuromonadales bacterium]|nr:YbbR-like domain-containing protein [Desulfuromonadales bacterium]